MDILERLESFIEEFNECNSENFAIDTIRVEFSKRYKLEPLKDLGKWHKINAKDTKILSKLKKRLTADKITTAYQLDKENIYYYNSKGKNYTIATMVIFGLKQYHKAPPNRNTTENILKILFKGKNRSRINIDICSDITHKPNLQKIKSIFEVYQYTKQNGQFTDSYYINRPDITMIEKIIIYNKALKNNLRGILWRVEAKISIPNVKHLAIPLSDLKSFMNVAREV